MTNREQGTAARFVQGLSSALERALAIKTAAELNEVIPRIEARAEGADITLKCRCGARFTWRDDNPAGEQCDECLDAAPGP